MKLFNNQNHRVGGKDISKVASVYDTLATSNRTQVPKLHISSFSPNENGQIRDHISKIAQELGSNELVKQASNMDKAAFLSGGIDLFTRAKGLIGSKLGITEDAAHGMTSPLINKTLKIQSTYGGDESQIMDRLVEEMQKQMIATTPGKDNAGDVREVMGVTSTKGLEDAIKDRLQQEVGLSSYEADHAKKTIISEARDLVTVLRPHKMEAIANAIIELVKEHNGDVTITYNLKDNKLLVEAVRSLLG